MSALNRIITSLLMVFSLLLVPTASQAEEFDLYIVPTVDEQLDSWLKTAPYMQPTIHLVENIYPSQPFALRLLFKGYSLSKLKNAFITYDVQIFDPEGKLTEDKGENLIGYNGPVKSNNYIIMNQQFLRISFDDKYQPGDYEILVTATDRTSKKVISKKEKISFKPFKRSGKFSSLDFYKFWIKNYFRQPDPAKAVFGLLQFFNNDIDWMNENRLLLSFGSRLLEDNPWIWNHLAEHYHKSPEERESIISLMALNAHQITKINQSFSQEQKSWFEEVSKLRRPSRNTIENLWGDFFATGNLDPLENIVRFLKPFALPELAGKKPRRKTDEEWAFWSLVEHGPDIPIVSIYCLRLLERGQLDQQNKIQLRLALDVIQKSLDERDADKAGNDKKTPLPLTR